MMCSTISAKFATEEMIRHVYFIPVFSNVKIAQFASLACSKSLFAWSFERSNERNKKNYTFCAGFLQKVKRFNFIKRKRDSSSTPQKMDKYTTFWKLNIAFFIRRIIGKELAARPLKAIPNYIYTKHRESYKKRWFYIPKKLCTFIWFAVFGGRGIIRGDFWARATISHLAYNSENKKDDFSWFLISKKLYTFTHFFGILEE